MNVRKEYFLCVYLSHDEPRSVLGGRPHARMDPSQFLTPSIFAASCDDECFWFFFRS